MSTFLVDANNLLLRSFLAKKPDMSAEGIDTGGLVIFINTLSRYICHVKPDRVLLAWDGGASAYRLKLYSLYKESRKKRHSDEAQPPFALVQGFLRAANLPQLQLPGYEGDDLIAATWKKIRHTQQVTILSSDKDLMQLIGKNTTQIKLTSAYDGIDRWDRNRMIKELGYKPEHVAYILALSGDKSDDIPGLARVGIKTAVKMLSKYDWNLNSLLKTLSKEDQNRVLLNYALVDLSEVPLELDSPPLVEYTDEGSKKWDSLMEFCDTYQLNMIKRRLQRNELWQ